jgi:putative PIN family toxin of toxin-antitoxin system
MRAVLDTVVFVRALINPKSRWGRLVYERSNRFGIVLSVEITQEILEVLQRPELREKMPRLDYAVRLGGLLARLGEAKVVEPTERPAVCRDRKDDKFFWCAAAASAAYIVSEDRDILDVPEYQGVKTVSAGEFLQILRG